MKSEFTYMGKQVKIAKNKAEDAAKLSIDDKKINIMLHTMGKPEDNYIKLWMCEGAYTMMESPELMAKHIIEYWHQYE
ncbi:MAG: hypothetical protein ACI8ZB_004016 [Desulforhopalus sp.]|jgi:hypothetical protein